jgi:hypothetical protein
MMSQRFVATTFLLSTLFFSCGETKEITLYLQDLQVNGPAMSPPIHITRDPEPNELHVMPRFSIGSIQTFTGRIDGHTMVNKNGLFQVDTIIRSDSGIVFQDRGNVNTHPFRGKNLRRSFPSYSVGFDMDFGLSRGVALSLGTNYSSLDGQGLWGYRAGLGFRHHRGSVGFRIDAGWQWEELGHEALTVVTERPLSGSVSTVAFYRDKGKTTFGRAYGSLVLHTVHPDWVVNPFFQLALTSQRLDDLKPTILEEPVWVIPPFFIVPATQNLVNDLRGKFSSTFVHFAPGLYFNLDENISILTGIRISVDTEVEDRSSSTIIAPFVQFDFRL